MWFSPTVGASKVTLVDHRRHLHAIMTLDTVEFPLVALTVTEKRLFGPVARLNTAMFTHNVVALFL